MLARLLDRWCVPRAADPRHDSPAAWLASSPRAPGLDDALESGVPVAVWVATAEDVAAIEKRARGAVLVSDAGDAVDGHDVMVVGGAIDVQRFPYVSPFVRARWRAAATASALTGHSSPGAFRSKSSPARRQPWVPPSSDMTRFDTPAVISDWAPMIERVFCLK